MPYTQTNWVAGVTPGSQPNMNNLETQYTEATSSLGLEGALEGFVLTGLGLTKTAANQVTLAAGTAFLKQTDNTYRRRAVSSTPETTSAISSTYFLDLNPDGTLSWATSHSGVTNYLPLASVTTDGSGNVNLITDARPLLLRWLGNASGLSVQFPPQTITLGNPIAAPSVTGMSAVAIAGSGMGAGAYKYVVTYAFDGGETLQSAAVNVTTSGGNNKVSLSGIPVSTDPRITRRKLYRTAVGGSTYSWVATLGDNSTTTYTDAASDASISSSVKVPPIRSTAGGTLRSGYPWSGVAANTAYIGVCTGVTFAQTSMVTGDSSTAALFNGTTDKIVVPGTGLPSGNQPWTLLVVTKPTNATNASDAIICAMGVANAGQSASIGQKAAGGWYAATFSGDTAAAGTSVAGTKHLVAGKWDGTTLTVNIDGGGATATATPGIRSLAAGNAMIGARTDSSLFYPGTVQKVAIFNYALSDQQIAFYNTLMGGASGNVTFDQQVADDGALRYYTLGDPVTSTTAAETSRLDTVFSPDGTLVACNLVAKQVGGTPTQGSQGVPAIVAQALDTHVTATTQQTIISYMVPVTGLYRVSGHASMSNSAPQSVTFDVQYTDPHLGTPTAVLNESSTGGGGFTPMIAATLGPTSSFAPAPTVVWASSGSTISVVYRDAGGTPNDYVSAVIERLA